MGLFSKFKPASDKSPAANSISARPISPRDKAEYLFNALEKSMAIIEFSPTGDIIWANRNFCQALGYKAEELEGKHHRLFCPKECTEGSEYRRFWQELGSGHFVSGPFQTAKC